MDCDEEEPRRVNVLLVEDSPGDVRLIKEAFHGVNATIRLHVAADGVEAMAYLRREGACSHSPRPDLILLDLNLPKMDGRETLALIKTDASLRTIPTVILTTSDRRADVEISYQLQANCFIQKPAQWDAFEATIRSINAFWLARIAQSQS